MFMSTLTPGGLSAAIIASVEMLSTRVAVKPPWRLPALFTWPSSTVNSHVTLPDDADTTSSCVHTQSGNEWQCVTREVRLVVLWSIRRQRHRPHGQIYKINAQGSTLTLLPSCTCSWETHFGNVRCAWRDRSRGPPRGTWGSVCSSGEWHSPWEQCDLWPNITAAWATARAACTINYCRGNAWDRWVRTRHVLSVAPTSR